MRRRSTCSSARARAASARCWPRATSPSRPTRCPRPCCASSAAATPNTIGCGAGSRPRTRYGTPSRWTSSWRSWRSCAAAATGSRPRCARRRPGSPRCSSRSTLDLDGARGALDPGTLLLSWSVGRTRTLLFALAAGPSAGRGLRVFTIPAGEESLRRRVALFRGLIARGRGSARGGAGAGGAGPPAVRGPAGSGARADPLQRAAAARYRRTSARAALRGPGAGGVRRGRVPCGPEAAARGRFDDRVRGAEEVARAGGAWRRSRCRGVRRAAAGRRPAPVGAAGQPPRGGSGGRRLSWSGDHVPGGGGDGGADPRARTGPAIHPRRVPRPPRRAVPAGLGARPHAVDAGTRAATGSCRPGRCSSACASTPTW